MRKHFRMEAKWSALEMVKGIRAELKKTLSEVSWLDDETRQAALGKVDAMSTHIGYPDEMMDDRKLEEYYQGLEIDQNNYLLSVLRLNTFSTDYAFNRLRKPVNKTDWVTQAQPAVVNAFYSPIRNSIREYIYVDEDR